MRAIPSFNVEEEPVGQETSQGPVGAPEEDLSLASPFLNKIPASDRTVVGRYIKDWDAGVTKKFQDYSSRIKPYEALGAVEELQQYRNFALNFRQNPEYMFKLMWEGLQQQYGEQFDAALSKNSRTRGQEMSDNGYEQEQEVGQEGPDPNEVFQQNVIQELEELA